MPPKNSKKKPDNETDQQQEDNPENVTLMDVYKLVSSVKEDTQTTRQKLDEIEVRVNKLEENQTEDSAKILDTQTDIEQLRDKMALLSGRLSRTELKNDRLQKEMSDLKAHSMKQNLIFSFDKKSNFGKKTTNRNCVDVVRQFLVEVMRIPSADTFYIPVAHPLAPNDSNSSPIIATFPVASEMGMVMSQTKELKGTHHFVTKQLPPEKRERKQFAFTEFSDLRKNPKIKARMVDDKLYVNGQLQRNFLQPAIPGDSCPVYSGSISESDNITDAGSVFHGYVADIKSLKDVRQVLDSLLRREMVASATHIILAYRFDSSNGTTENFDSDGDHGVGLRLLKEMQKQSVLNKLFVVTRACSQDFAHIGSRRFDHAIEVCFSAL